MPAGLAAMRPGAPCIRRSFSGLHAIQGYVVSPGLNRQSIHPLAANDRELDLFRWKGRVPVVDGCSENDFPNENVFRLPDQLGNR